ncbi:MAG: succinate dehydrogenase, hydrophobic membrane anchor protein [Betaproteobacteria bacterium]|nr:MAG: succinate dehydrogenase, hydrophobic membrane anchor protein [Betaproteobacteria bacterium]TAN56446.1 MAG: succinate dehydrogenase, hydrophobic membrane anchor protein [Betaproteobacteria bacterium]
MVSRVVVGAHYGLRDWLAQRITGVLIAVYAVALAAVLLTMAQPITYAAWKDLFARGWMRVATLLFAVSVAWHAWVGMRDILMDYIKPAGVRLALQVGVLLTLAAYLGWTIQILWR